MTPRIPDAKHVVLVGGGHTHVTVVKSLGMTPEPSVVVTLIAKELDAPYSGMLPGLVAGHYTFDQCHIDLVRLSSWASVRIVHGEVTGFDRARKQIAISGRPPLTYDIASIDVGITPKLSDIPGAAEHGIAVKPVSTFFQRWQELESAALEPAGPRRIAMIGAGAAGFEVILAVRHRLRTLANAAGIDPNAFTFVLIGSGGLLPTHNRHAQRLARRSIDRQSIELVEGDRVISIETGTLRLSSGITLAVDAVLFSTEATAAPWFAASDMPVDDKGFLAIRPTLQLLDDDDVFAAGDCATMLAHRREKAGVFAVRQGPPLVENIRLRARNQNARPFVPQSDFLTILSTGDKHAIAARNGFAFSGRAIWHWKDRIDLNFMNKFELLPTMPTAVADSAAEMRCSGCAAKVGPVTLFRALERLGRDQRQQDDVAIVDERDGMLRLETLDFFRAIWPEPYVLGRIAATHALNDILAKGGAPTHALANVVLPYARPPRVEEDLFQVLAGAKSAFCEVGTDIVGGHSSEGGEMSIGFFVSGRVPRERMIAKRGLRAGDALVLTRPIGTGILFAGLMRGIAKGADVATVLAAMQAPAAGQAKAALTFAPSAGTDVTGFGLGGHLLEMIGGTDLLAEINLDAVPLYHGVISLAHAGVASSLMEENIRLADSVTGSGCSDAATLAILFDPQTSGGFLFGVAPQNASELVSALKAAGAQHAAVIGHTRQSSASAGRVELFGSFSSR